MNGEPDIAVCGDPYYVNLVAIDMLNCFGWSRKRRRKWLRRWNYFVNRERAIREQNASDQLWFGDWEVLA